MIKIDNVLNYVPKTIIEECGDNDQLLSWAVQGYKLLKIPGTQDVKDSDIFEVVNHKVQLPMEAKVLTDASLCNRLMNDWTYFLTRADYYSGDNLLQKDITTTYQEYFNQTGDTLTWTNTGILDQVILFRNGNFETDFTVTNGIYLTVNNHVDGNNYIIVNTQTVYTTTNDDTSRTYDNALIGIQNFDYGTYEDIKIIRGKTSRNALCSTCAPAVVQNGRTLEFSFESGLVKLEYTVPFTDLDNNIIVPEEPHVLWLYMAKYVEEQHLQHKMLRSPEAGNDGYYKQRMWMNLYQQAKSERSALYDAARTQVVLRNIDMSLQYQIVYGRSRMMKLPTYLHRNWSQRYSDSSFYLNRSRSIQGH